MYGVGGGGRDKKKGFRNVGEGREVKCMDCVILGCSVRMIFKIFFFIRKLECDLRFTRFFKGFFVE